MARDDDSVYYAKRALDEWAAARNASNPPAAIAHATLARGYEAKADGRRVDEAVERVALE